MLPCALRLDCVAPRRILAAALACLMTVTLLPAAAFADASVITTFRDLQSAISAASGGTEDDPIIIEIGAGFELTAMITPPADTCIELTSGAGGPYTLTVASSFTDSRGFSVTGGSTLILENIVLDGSGVNKPLVDVRSGKLVISDGAVLQNSSSCAVQVQVDNTPSAKPVTSVVMNGGELKNNAGGGIYMNITYMSSSVQQALSLDINGGKITGNGMDAGSCGGIYARKMVNNATAQVTISDCEITGNKAKNGGGIFVDCPFEMTGGEIGNNTASIQGGGIFISENQEPVINGGTITGNTAAGDSGSPAKGKGNNVYTRSVLQLGSGVNIPDGVFLQTLKENSPDTVLLLPATLNNPIEIEGAYRINPNPMINMPVAKTADGNAMSQDTFGKLSLEGMEQFRLALDESGVVRLGNTASGQPLIFYSEYLGNQLFDGTAPSQSGDGWDWEAGTKTLTLSGATVETDESYALLLPPDAKIVLAEDTTSTFTKTGRYYSVFGEGPLEITGPGKLVVTGSVIGLSAVGALTIDGCEIDATGTSNGGIYGYDGVTISTSTLNVAGGIVLEGGTLNISDTDAVIDGTHYSAITVALPNTGATLADYLKIADLPEGMKLHKGEDSGSYYATVADSEEHEVLSLTLRAPERYTITFNANGGNPLTPSTAQTSADGKLSTLPTPTRSGSYRFDGWFKADNTPVTAETEFTGDTEIFAHWTYTGGSSGDSSNTTTSTTHNPDGSVTTTVKKPNGTITETTKAPDGTKTVVETKKDGSRTETVTTPDGGRTETATTAQGDRTYAEERPDGAKISADIPKGGGATAAVELPGDMAAPVAVSFPATDGTVVLRVHPDGTEEPVTYSLVEDGRAYVRLDSDAKLRVETRAGLFDDMDGHWAEESADFAGARALLQGTAPRTFSPERPMTRAMLATVLYRIAGAPGAGGAAFSDVEAGSWYADGVAWAAEHGIAAGTGGGLFSADRAITRQELAVMLWNYARYDGIDVYVGENTSILSFTDIDKTEDWAIPALQWACGAGILQGGEDGALDPAGPATRAEVAAMLERFIAAAVKAG